VTTPKHPENAATPPGPAEYGSTPYPTPDLRERAASPRGGEPQVLSRRVYGQLQVYTDCKERQAETLVKLLKASKVESVLYLDVNDPHGVGVLALSEDPFTFAGPLRDVLGGWSSLGLRHRPELTMIGRTYATGREPNLEFALLKKPRVTALNPEWPWAVWYPLRRKGTFAVLPAEKQGKILHEHAQIGIAFGQADYAHDIRLNCVGLDQSDNDFVIGLIGKELTPLSQCVQEMRKTQQTAKYIRKLGPFFVGRALWQSPLPV